LDVIVTSAANFQDSHSQLKKNFLEYSPETVDGLERDGCIGDLLWQPISTEKLLDMSKYDYRPVTITRLEDLPDLAARGKKIVLALGPCAAPEHSQAEASKAAVLEAILNHSLAGKTSITHLVVDSRTAQELMRDRGTEPKTSAAAAGSDSPSAKP
jgi:DNA-binding transcriptional regulator LsrR (DeoR family)